MIIVPPSEVTLPPLVAVDPVIAVAVAVGARVGNTGAGVVNEI